MVSFPEPPVVGVHAEHINVQLRLRSGSYDHVWRALFNDNAEDAKVNAEATRDSHGTVIVIRFPKGTSHEDTVAALDRVYDVARLTNEGLWDRRNREPGVKTGAAEWWRRQRDVARR